MKKMFTMVAVAAMTALGVSAQQKAPEISYDFVPEVQSMVFQEIPDSETGALVSQVRIDVKFSEDVWWVQGVSSYCYVLDSKGEKVEWTPDFSGPSSDYSMFYFGVNGLNKYVDEDYTLVIPEGVFGNTAWYSDAAGSQANPELKYEFNVWKLAGCPRENHTVYDFNPTEYAVSLEEVRINGQRQLELQLSLEFPEAVAISDEFRNKWSVYSVGGEEESYMSEAVVRAWVPEDNASKVIVGLRGVDLKNKGKYRISIWSGAFGTLEWAAEDYCEGRSNSPLEYIMDSDTSGVMNVEMTENADAPVFNMQGVRMNAESLLKGIYIRDGKKFVVK